MVVKRGYVGGGSHFRYLVATLRPRPSAEAYLPFIAAGGRSVLV
jgi:hypothetical protein